MMRARPARWVALLALPVVLTLSVLVNAQPAHADPSDRVLVSVDGVHWHTGNITGLLGNLGELVPGASISRMILVKNDSRSAAVLRVAAVVGPGSSAQFIDDLRLGAARDEVEPTLVRVTVDTCLPLVTEPTLNPGEVASIRITAGLDPTATNQAQSGASPVTVFVSLVEATGGALPAVTCTVALPRVIAATGTELSDTLTVGLGLSLSLLAAGWAALAVHRRDRREP